MLLVFVDVRCFVLKSFVSRYFNWVLDCSMAVQITGGWGGSTKFWIQSDLGLGWSMMVPAKNDLGCLFEQTTKGFEYEPV